MKNKEDMTNYNSKGQFHGYQERYHYDNKLMVRGNSKNGLDVGYQEWHNVKETEYYIR